MYPVSLGYRTDLIFPKFDGELLDRGDYLVIATPNNPTFYWGNFLLFRSPPGSGDSKRWKELFARELGTRLGCRHLAFGWDDRRGETGEIGPFLDEGFELNSSVVLSASRVEPPQRRVAELVIRPLVEDGEWEAALRVQLEDPNPGQEAEAYRDFKTRQQRRYRAMTRAGLGFWFGAFLSEELVADLGLYRDGSLARFQNVETRREYRRRGICANLVYEASRYAFSNMGVERLVMVADEDYEAARVYESVGFAPCERQVGIEWWERSGTAIPTAGPKPEAIG